LQFALNLIGCGFPCFLLSCEFLLQSSCVLGVVSLEFGGFIQVLLACDTLLLNEIEEPVLVPALKVCEVTIINLGV